MRTIGIDVSTKSIALASVFRGEWGGEIVHDELWSRHEAFNDRLRELAGLLSRKFEAERAFVRSKKAIPETVVYIEDIPFMQGQNGIHISQMIGLVKTVLTLQGMSWKLVNISTWKKETVGKGNASKQEVKDWVDHIWGIVIPLGSQNLYDATAIACYGAVHER